MNNSLTSSVILCTRNRYDDLMRCLTSLKYQTTPPTEIIIIDSSTQPLTTHQPFILLFTAEHFPHSHLIYKHTERGLTFQRNQGVACARGDILYFFDDDVILSPTYIEKMNHSFFMHPTYGGGMGTVTDIPFTAPFSPKKLFKKLFLLQHNEASGCFTSSGMPTHPYNTLHWKQVEVLGGCCMAYRSWIFKKELFDEKLRYYGYMEDCDFSKRASMHCPLFFNPEAALEHHNSPVSRDSRTENRAMFIANYGYLFFKNFYPDNKLRILAYCWSMKGLLLEALIFFMVRRKVDYLKGYFKGLRFNIKTNFTQPYTPHE